VFRLSHYLNSLLYSFAPLAFAKSPGIQRTDITMDTPMQTNGQSAIDQNSSDQSPPQWFQVFMQQMLQTHNDQMNEIVQRINAIEQRTQAQGQPPSSSDQATPTPMPATPPTPAVMPTPTTAPTPNEQFQRPRPKLPDVEKFTGKRSEWRTWKIKMEEKLERDQLAIGDRMDRFAYINARLDDTPAKMVSAYVERVRKTSSQDPDHFMAYLHSIYGNTNTKEHAVNKLNTMSQGKEAFATFLPKFETTLADAGGGEWTDEVKINTLKRALSQEMRKSFIYMPALPTEYSAFIDTLQTLASRLAAFDREFRKPTAPTTPKPPLPSTDEMDWQPSTNKVQASGQSSANKVQSPTDGQGEQKRAQWVSKDTLEKRRSNNLCLRCGGKGHFIGNCRLLPAKPPQQGQTKAKVTNVKEDDDVAVIEELDSDTESGKE
jgi:cell pole-organizing protein PopZ